MKKLLVLTLGLCAFSSVWAGERGMYAGAGLGRATLNSSDGTFNFDAKNNTLIGLIGYNINPNWAAEFRLGAGSGGETVNNATVLGVAVTSKVKLDYYSSAYAKGTLPLGDAALYGLLGISTAKTSVTASAGAGARTVSASGNGTDTGLSYGLGGQYNFTPNIGVNLEWVRILSKNDLDLDSVAGGIIFRF